MVAKKLETKHECGLDRKLCMYLPCIARRTKKIQVPAGSRARAAGRPGRGKRAPQPGLFFSTRSGLLRRGCQHHPSTAAPRVQPESQPHSASSCRRICTPPTAPVTEAESSGGAGACFLLSLIVSSIHSSRVGVSEL